MEFTLAQGDLIYIPRGFVHAAECGAEASLHITLGVNAVTVADLLQAALKAATLRTEGLRAALPPGFMQGGAAPLAAQAAAALGQIADAGFLAGVVDQFRDERVRTFPLDVAGQVVEFFRPRPLALADIVGPRPGTVLRMQTEDAAVRVHVGARSILFPALFGPALAFALNTPSFPIGVIPGALVDEERIVFVERLLEEGLLVRSPSAVGAVSLAAG